MHACIYYVRIKRYALGSLEAYTSALSRNTHVRMWRWRTTNRPPQQQFQNNQESEQRAQK